MAKKNRKIFMGGEFLKETVDQINKDDNNYMNYLLKKKKKKMNDTKKIRALLEDIYKLIQINSDYVEQDRRKDLKKLEKILYENYFGQDINTREISTNPLFLKNLDFECCCVHLGTIGMEVYPILEFDASLERERIDYEMEFLEEYINKNGNVSTDIYMNDFITRQNRCGQCECCKEKKHHIKISQLYELLKTYMIFTTKNYGQIKKQQCTVHSESGRDTSVKDTSFKADTSRQLAIRQRSGNELMLVFENTEDISDAVQAIIKISKERDDVISEIFFSEIVDRNLPNCNFKTIYEIIINELLELVEENHEPHKQKDKNLHFLFIAILREELLKNNNEKLFLFDFEIHNFVLNIKKNYDSYLEFVSVKNKFEDLKEGNFEDFRNHYDVNTYEFFEAYFNNDRDIRIEQSNIFKQSIHKSFYEKNKDEKSFVDLWNNNFEIIYKKWGYLFYNNLWVQVAYRIITSQNSKKDNALQLMYTVNAWYKWLKGEKKDKDDINDIIQLQNQIKNPDYLYKEYYYDKPNKQRRICVQDVDDKMLEKSKKIIEKIICSSLRFYANFDKRQLIHSVSIDVDSRYESIKCYINEENKLTPESCIIDPALEKKINEFDHRTVTDFYISQKKYELLTIHKDFCITARYINYLKYKLLGNLNDVENYTHKLNAEKTKFELYIELIRSGKIDEYHKLIESKGVVEKQTQDQLLLLGL